jgi:hypothetical protein
MHFIAPFLPLTLFNVPYQVQGEVVQENIFKALSAEVKEQYELTNTWTNYKLLYVTTQLIDIAKDKANSALQMNIAVALKDNARFQCGKTHHFVIVPAALKGGTSSSLGGSMFTAPATIKKGVETFVGQKALQMLQGKPLHSCLDKIQLVRTQDQKKKGLLTLATTAANRLNLEPHFKDDPKIQIVIDSIKNMIPDIPVTQFPSAIRLKRSGEGSSSSSGGGIDNGNDSAPGSPPSVSVFRAVSSPPTSERIPCPFPLCVAQNFTIANFCKACRASLFCVPCKENGNRIRFDEGAKGCTECGADVPTPRVGSVREENQDGNAQRTRHDNNTIATP